MRFLLPILFIIQLSTVQANSPDSLSNHKKKSLCFITGFGGTAVTHLGLYQLWYKDFPASRFHFFNDNHEWNQIDKCGHAFSSYYLGISAIEAAKWAGVPKRQQWKWALFGSIFQDPIELWDGFSQGWGASVGDLLSNSFGTFLAAGQHALWNEQKLNMKFSYTPSDYAKIRPNTLGSSLPEKMLKDYNAQTYWLTYTPEIKNKPAWLGLAIGYGSNGLLGGESNQWTDKNNIVHDERNIIRYRQYFLSLDFNLTKIKTKKKGLKVLLFLLNCIKLPAPALEFSQNKIRGHWLMF